MALKLDHVNYIYDADTEMAHVALKDVTLEIGKGEFIGLIGHTGSGKSTLVTHLNGLVKPTSGKVLFDGQDINEKDYDRNTVRTTIKALCDLGFLITKAGADKDE